MYFFLQTKFLNMKRTFKSLKRTLNQTLSQGRSKLGPPLVTLGWDLGLGILKV
jgi:hypothetical protein